MKKIIFLFILTSTLSCKKGWLDYTNKYTGNFEFTVDYYWFNSLTGVRFDTAYVYNGTIKKIKRGEIKIKFGSRQNDFFDVEIDKEGDFSEGYLSGSFSDKNNVKIYFRTGGQGGGGRYDITGKRN